MERQNDFNASHSLAREPIKNHYLLKKYTNEVCYIDLRSSTFSYAFLARPPIAVKPVAIASPITLAFEREMRAGGLRRGGGPRRDGGL